MTVDPEKRKRNDRARYQKLKADPEKYQAFLARQKELRQARRAAGIPIQHRSPLHLAYDRGRILENEKRYKAGDSYKASRRESERRKKEAMATRARPDACEICNTVGKRGVVYDHDHVTETFRGWLCDRCNRAIGLLKDDVELVLKVALYLETHKSGIPEMWEEVNHGEEPH